MIRIELSVEDLADTRFAISPVHEIVVSLRTLRDPGLNALHLPWRRTALARLDGGEDRDLLLSLVGERLALPDFLTPRPEVFAPEIGDELAVARRTPPAVVRRDLRDALTRIDVPEADAGVRRLRDRMCDALERYWRVALEPSWAQMRLVMEADTTYRARQLAVGGARLLFADMHPNLRWRDGVLHIDKMVGRHTVRAAGRGLLLMPSVFAHKPAPPVGADEPPALSYPSRGIGTLWAPPPPIDPNALTALLGRPRAGLIALLAEPLATVEIARRLRVTPSAVSQHLRVLYAAGLVTRTRDGRQVLYRRSPLGDGLVSP